jgi:glycosyltransferase involved in cell wall biosynthesis
VIYLDHLDSLVYAGRLGGSRVVVDMHNVYSRLALRAANEADGLLRRRYLAMEARLLERMERRAAALAHTILAVSGEEAHYFRGLGAKRVVVVPNGVDCSAYEPVAAVPRHGAPTILYVGSLAWPPNASAARFLAMRVLPAVRERLPDVRLVIVGKDPPADVRALGDGGNVTVAANVPDVIPYYRDAHVLAVPLQAGGGTRLKILEAFAAGLPVVSTALGCEGLEAIDGQHLIVAERSEFAQAITDLLAAPARAQSLTSHARALALAQYDWRIVGALAAEAVRRAAGELDSRTKNPAIEEPGGTGQTTAVQSTGRL